MYFEIFLIRPVHYSAVHPISPIVQGTAETGHRLDGVETLGGI